METFDITQNHLKLLYAMYIRWEDCEYGAPAVDCKRPYGNSSVEQDVIEMCRDPMDKILVCPYCNEKIFANDLTRDEAAQLHKEMGTVLQILVQNCVGGVQVGTYEFGGRRWLLKKDTGFKSC